MSKGKDNNQSVKQKEYQNFAKDREPKRPVIKNCIKAFVVGGLISTFGQLIQWFFINYFHFNEKNAGDPTAAVLIIISVLLTGLGVFDHIGQWAGAGTAIPITGFANSMASAAIEHRSEGYVLGTGGNMFKLAGSVITFGVFSAFVVGILRFIFKWLGGM
jgi:stage V sporulation protein AC